MTERPEQDPRAALPVRRVDSGPMTKHETEDMWPIFEQMIVDGFTNTEIANRLGINRKTVTEWRKKYTTREARRNANGHVVGTENDRITAECIRLYSGGMSYLEIAEQMGLNYNTVRSRLRKAYAAYVEKERDTFAARQYADLQMMKQELLPLIIKDHADDLDELINNSDGIDYDDNNAIHSLVERAFHKGRKNFDTKVKAMEVFLKLLEREAKLFGLDAAQQLNVNQTIKVQPEAIELLGRIKASRESNVVDVEFVDNTEDPLELGNM